MIEQSAMDARRAAGAPGAPTAFSGLCRRVIKALPGLNKQEQLKIVLKASIFLLLFRIDL